MSNPPPYYDVFENYFKSSEKPSLEEFVEKYKSFIVTCHQENENLKQVWSRRYGYAHCYFFRDIPKDQKPKCSIDNPDWGNVALDILVKKVVRESHDNDNEKSHTTTTNSTSPATSTTSTTTTSSLPPITTEFLDNFRKTHQAMVKEEMWVLSSGKIVEDVLFSFGLTRQYEHSSHSFILDLSDEDLRMEFTTKELEEMNNEKPHPLPPASSKLLDYLNSFVNLKTIHELETRVRKRLYDFDEEFEMDWAQLSIQCAIRLFRAKYFPLTDQTESDIIRRVWTFIDTVFDDIDVAVRTGEMESVASSERKNEQRAPNQRKQHGHRTDILFKVSQGEIGCSEVGKKDSGDMGTKEMKELGLKVPKMMKDQMWRLARDYREKSGRLAIIGYVMMGLKLRVVIMDNPRTYICRINRTPAYFFPSTIETFGSKLGSLLALVSQVKGLAKHTLDVLDESVSIQSSSYISAVTCPPRILPCPPSPKTPLRNTSSTSKR